MDVVPIEALACSSVNCVHAIVFSQLSRCNLSILKKCTPKQDNDTET